MAWKYREVVIEDDKSVGDSGTETIDLNITDPISELIVRFRIRNDTAVVNNQPPELQISKIEIVDGGQVHWSLYGEMAVAAAVYDKDKWPSHWYDESLSVYQNISIPLQFGRYPGDTQFGLDLSRMLNPQLKFTWAEQDLYDDGYCSLGVTARVMEGAPRPPRCLMWREIETWTTASSGVRKVDLPVDHPYRRLLIRVYQYQAHMWQKVSNFKLDCDVGKFIAFDMNYSEFYDVVKGMFGPHTFRKSDRFDNNGNSATWFGVGSMAQGTPALGGTILSCFTTGGNYIIQKCEDDSGSGLSDKHVELLMRGYFPHSSIAYQFGLKDDPDTWFNAREYGEVALKLTQGSAGAEATVAIQQPITL